MNECVVDDLATLIDQEHAIVTELLTVLEQESHALMHNDIRAIESTAQSKKQLLDRFQTQVQHRLDFLSTRQMEPSEQGFKDFLHTLVEQSNHPIHEQWGNLRQDFADLIKKNEENGIVIHHSQHRARSLLNILHGKENQPNLYNESGAAKGQGQRHRLGEA